LAHEDFQWKKDGIAKYLILAMRSILGLSGGAESKFQ
jgi:hypothetical protein